jgi:hypothetical protein
MKKTVPGPTMSRRTPRVAAILVGLSAVLALGAPSAASAATRYVDDGGSADSGDCTNPAAPCSTVQYAVNQAVAGDSIQLAAGTYTPGAAIDKANLTITGAGPGQTTVNSSAGQPRAFDLRAAADGVTISALTLRGPFSGIGVPADHSGIYVGATPGLDVADLVLADLEITRFRFAIDVRIPGSATGWTLSSVNAHVNQYGARFWGPTRSLTVAASHFDFNTFGLYTQHPGTTPRTPGVFDDVEIGDTSFDGNASKGLYLEQGSGLDLHGLSVTSEPPPIPGMDVNPINGIDLNVKYGDFANVRIADSVFSGATDAGVLVHGRNDAPSYNTVPATLVGVVLEGLEVTGNGGTNAGSAGGVWFGNAVADASLARSRIVDNVGGGVTSYTDPGPASTVDATGNWWGCNEGPTANGDNDCSRAVGDLDADPWLVLLATASRSAIATGGASSTITAAVATDSNGAPATAAAGLPAVAFASGLGSIAPIGAATAVLTSGLSGGRAHVTASLDDAEATVEVEFVEPTVNSAAPVVSGDAVVGTALSCSLGSWTGAGLTYARQWTRGDTDIVGQTATSYTTVPEDVGHAVGCRVTATNSIGASSDQTAETLTIRPPAGVLGIVKPIARPRMRSGGRAAIATVSCVSATGCSLAAPRRIRIRIDGRTYRARVIAPAGVSSGGTGVIEVRLRPRARHALRRHGSARVRLNLTVTGRGPTIVTSVKARLRSCGRPVPRSPWAVWWRYVLPNASSCGPSGAPKSGRVPAGTRSGSSQPSRATTTTD